ncbi:MAG: 3'-5' exonuclease [Clostridia bacterium]|nr:3'-5' exonuclease [Clostridia bacterium]
MVVAASPVAFDIETVGLDWQDLHADVRDYLLRRARTEADRESVPERLALHPGTGRIVAVAFWRPFERRGGVLVEGPPGEEGWRDFEDDAKVFRGPEAALLTEFWRMVRDGAGTLISFNGRRFDGPFLMLRSAILGVRPTRNLVPYRYRFRDHCDLAEVLSFFGTRPYDSLLFWCRQFGLPSPKETLDGAGVARAYRDGEMDAIARYCLADARAVAELFLRLQPVIDLLDARDGE